jgi:hypothetical protein
MSEKEVYTHQKPLISVYGKDAPRAAEFNKGARNIEEVREATEARRNQKPGVYGQR